MNQPANQDADRSHKSSVFYEKDGKRLDTGLKKAALEDYNKRLIVNTERPQNGSR